MRRLSPLSRALASITLALTLFAGCGYKNALKQGDAAMAAQHYEEALGHYKRALELKPDSAEAKDKVAQAQDRAVAARIDTGKRRLADKDFHAAIGEATGAVAILPESAAVRAFVDEVITAVTDEGERLSAAGVHAEALALLDRAIAGLPAEKGRLEGPRKAAADRWTAALDASASAAEAAGRLADALLQRAMIADLGGDAGARDRLLAALKAKVAYRVGTSPARDPATTALAQRLVGADRSGRWLEILAPGPAPADAAATLAFTLQKARFATDKSDRSESAKYQSGTKQVPNPFYKSAQDKVADQERRVLEAEKEVSKQQQYVQQYQKDVAKEGDTPNVSTGAEQNLYNAENRLEAANRSLESERNQLQQRRDELQRTQPTTDEPVYTTVQYKITTHVLTASARVSGAITPKGGAKIEIGRELSAQAKDDTNDALPAANIAADPLDLPSKEALEGQLADAALAEIGARVGQAFDAYRKGVLDGGAGGDDRIDRMVLFLLLDPGAPDPALDDALWKARGIPDASARLRRAQGLQ